ncbi:hypothetical protein AB0L41_06415 [Amycolatopsis mediterranei]|uniref:hypothetical protein n=1 Tax=Amycolatopsis mediterranei TaxID=33910 RepID=UPI0034364F30
MRVPDPEPGELSWDSLAPYLSLVVLEAIDDDPAEAFAELVAALVQPSDRRARKQSTLLARAATAAGDDALPLQAARIDQLEGFVNQVLSLPGWAQPDAPYDDMVHELTLVARRKKLFAVHTNEGLRRRLERILDSAGTRFRRIPPAVLEGALLQGAAKGLWLKGTHARLATRPDSKVFNGRFLQRALNPLEDSFYGLGAARAELPADPGREVLRGVIGTTPGKSLIWYRGSAGMPEFLAMLGELLTMVEDGLTNPQDITGELGLLARRVSDLAGVHDAFEVIVATRDEVVSEPGLGDDAADDAALLENAILDVRGDPDAAGVVVDVGHPGVVAGSLRGTVHFHEGAAVLQWSSEGIARDPALARDLCDALSNQDIISVFYGSGHVLVGRDLWRRNTQAIPFARWDFEDFSGFEITKEKPLGLTSVDIHDAIGRDGDRSLFGWVLHRFSEGWLICDDGSGEVADFLHLTRDGVLSVIHVKGAASSTGRRKIRVTAYEVIAAQAQKNLIFSEPERLVERLAERAGEATASWVDGVRVKDRSAFFERLRLRDATSRTEVLVVQPHVNRKVYEDARRTAVGADRWRLQLLDTLLNAARAAAVMRGADLRAVGSA